jgi:hypothetical protein
MAKQKERKPNTLQVKCWAGTPHELEIEVKTTPTSVKSFLHGRVQKRQKWAWRFNHAMATELAEIMQAIDSINIQALNVGEVFEWSSRDAYTGIKLVFGLEVQAK